MAPLSTPASPRVARPRRSWPASGGGSRPRPRRPAPRRRAARARGWRRASTPVTGLGAHEQHRARGLARAGAERAGRLERRVQAPQRLEQRARRRARAVRAHHRVFHLWQRREDLGVERLLDLRERAEPAVEAAQDVGGDRRQQQAEDAAEDRVLFRRRRDRQRAGSRGLTCCTPELPWSADSSWLILLASVAAWIVAEPAVLFPGRWPRLRGAAAAASRWRSPP